MIRETRTHFVYKFEEEDRQALMKWLKENNLKLKDVHKKIGVSYFHLSRVVRGRLYASATVINKIRKMLGVKI